MAPREIRGSSFHSCSLSPPQHTPLYTHPKHSTGTFPALCPSGGRRFMGGVDPSAGEQCPPPIFADVFLHLSR